MKNQILGYNNTFLTNHFLQDVRAGYVPGFTANDKFGYNLDVGTSYETIWTVGGNPTFQTSAGTIEAISSDTNDTVAGTGARKIIVIGLDANWDEITEEIEMNGTSASAASTKSFIRVNRAYVSECGTYGGTAIGAITIRKSGAGATFTNIVADAGQTHQAFFSVPRNKRIYVYSLHMAVDSGKQATIRARARNNADVTSAPFSAWRDQLLLTGIVGFNENEFHVPWIGEGKSDLVVQAKVPSTAAAVSAYWEYILEDVA